MALPELLQADQRTRDPLWEVLPLRRRAGCGLRSRPGRFDAFPRHPRCGAVRAELFPLLQAGSRSGEFAGTTRGTGAVYEAELDHLHELEEKYHAHLDREVVELSGDEDKLLGNWLFRGIQVGDSAGVTDLYRAALEMEVRTRDHFQKLARELPPGLEKDLCAELAAEEEEHVAMLQGELEQLG